MRNLFPSVFSLLGLMIVLTGCGDTSLGDNVHISLDPNQQVARMEVEMSDGLEVSLSGSFDIADGYGTLYFEPATKTENAKIVVEFDVAQAINDQLDGFGLVTSLPNGAPLPVAMTPPLVGIPVIENGSVNVEAVASILPELQVGALIGIEQFKTQYFPMGVAICQNFRNSENYAFAAVCLYGPSNTESGGIFVGGNFGQVLDLDILSPEEPAVLALSSHSSRALSVESKLRHVSVMDAVNFESSLWTEQRYDPSRRLQGSTGHKALQNAKKILKARR